MYYLTLILSAALFITSMQKGDIGIDVSDMLTTRPRIIVDYLLSLARQ